MTLPSELRRIDLGYFIRPPDETGTGQVRVEPVLAYAVPLHTGWLLFDTGLGEDDDVDAHYRPTRRPLEGALQTSGLARSDVRIVVNCHLHFDHCGGNPLFAGLPVVTQEVELEQARSVESYTLPHLVDFAGVRYELLDGEAELSPGVWVIPTPGHTQGHQSLVVQCADGAVVVAGQAHDVATDYTSAYLGRQAERDDPRLRLPETHAWMKRLEQFDAARVVFAHDMAVWERG